MATITKIVLSFVVASAVMWGQAASTAQINGTVRDSTGLAIPGAAVKVTQTATGLVRNATSGVDGAYVFPNLPVGPYLFEVTKDGFTKYVQSGILLQVDSNPTIDASLKVGSVTDQVTVQADAAMVETHSTGVGTLVDNQRVVEMPLNGRNATELVFLAGMATVGGQNGGFLNSVRNYPTVMISVAGGVANQQTYALDGANHNDAYNGLNLPLPFPDALQEFKVETSALAAQYGLHSTAAISAITKSGTNTFHGDAFEFLRNGDLNARDFFAPRRDSLKRNQFGGTIGGPIVKDRLFFFAGYQGTIQKSEPTQAIAFVPTPAMLAGDFTTFAGPQCNNGATINLKGFGFSGNKISPSALNPAALKIDSFLPTSADPCGKVNYGLTNNLSEHMGVTRIDYQISEKNTIFGRFYETNLEQPSTFDGKDALTLNSNAQHDRVYSLALGETYVFSPNVVSSVRLGANRAEIPKIIDNFATWPQLLVNAPYNPAPAPRISVTGNGFAIGSGNSIINHDMTGPDPNLVWDISWVKGNHQIGFGASYLRTLINYVSGINATGLPTFNGSITGLPMADFMVGQAAAWTQGNISYFYNRQNYIGMYVQDSWRVTSRLTLNYGVRWEPFLPITSKQGLFMRFDQSLFNEGVRSIVHVNAPPGVVFPGDSQWTTGNSIAQNRWNEFVPRFGLAWDPTGSGKMTIRAAFGSYTDRSGLYALSSFGQDPPIGNVVTVNNVNLSNPWANYPGGNPLPIALSKTMPFPNFGAYITYPQDWKPVWVNQWNFSIQRQLGKDWLVTANYLGNNTFHLVTADELNPAVFMGTGACIINGVHFANCGTTATNNQRRPLNFQDPSHGLFGIVSQGSPSGTGSYNSLFLSAQKRLSQGTTILANYTYSHCISDEWNGQPGNVGTSSVTPNNRRADRSNCAPNLISSDQRHLFNLSVVAQTPRFANRALRIVASDWQVSPILKLRSAQYFTVVLGTDVALNGEGNQRPNLISGANVYASSQSCKPAPCIQWLNSAPGGAGVKGAFATPAVGSLGNLGIGNLAGPGVFQLDLALSRMFVVHEGQTLQLRTDVFNLPNHLNPGVPGYGNAGGGSSALNAGNFGQITSDISGTSGLSAGDYRVIQVALKFVF
ncbi:MAG TPA: TonB-dependent receptor [Bryobacteraceae bacterium]|nr:TonB-dependent receptor [Bryobacteraceae bacterium]